MKQGAQGVGNVLLLEEVYPTTETLGRGTNVILVKRVARAVPLKVKMVDIIRPVEIQTPGIGDTKWFCKHNETNLRMWNAQIVASIKCGGYVW